MHWAVKVLTDEGDREKPWLSYHYPWIATGLFGFGLAIGYNALCRRPYFSGIHKHILLPIAGAAFGYQVNEWKEQSLAERDAQLRHYIELHPDDFPQPERIKYAQLMEPWAPIR